MFEELDQLIASDIFTRKAPVTCLPLKEGERREVCILFADVKGFTDLSEQLDHEEVHTILDKLMQLFTLRIKHYGGYIDKYEGDLVMALFGAKVASESDTERAIHAALQMLEVLEQFNQLLAKKLQTDVRMDVRIGINTGWVTTGRIGEKRVGDFTVYGDAVNLASRMESNAPVNHIMLPEATMLTVRDAFEFEDHGEITVKGKSRPVSVFLVKGLRAEIVHRWQTRRSAYVGRDDELTLLAEKYDLIKQRMAEAEFHEYKPLVIGIKGEPGIGKSRLADEFLRSLQWDRHSCLSSEKETDKNVCPTEQELFYLHGTTPSIAQPPYCMFTSLMRRYFTISQIDDRETARSKLEVGLKELEGTLYDSEEVASLRDILPFLGRLLGIPYEDVRLQLGPRELQPHLQTAFRIFLETAAARANRENSPLVIILEDLQWLDEPSAAILEFLMLTLNLEEKRKRKHFKHLLILLTYRPEYAPSRQMKIDADFQEIELTSINEENGEELIQSMSGDIFIPEKTLQMVMEKSAGNPFYIEEWVNLILATPELDRQADLPVPNTLHALVLSRIDRLEQDIKLLLQKGAVIGREFFVKVLEEMEKKLERYEDISEHLEHLESGDFVLPSPGAKISAYLFKHIITQEVAYNTLLIANRKILHKIAAEVIEELFAGDLEPHFADLAEHYDKAKVTDKAIEYFKKAADYAKDHYQNEAAIRLYNRLLSLLKSESADDAIVMMIEVFINKGGVLQLIGNWKQAEETFQQALVMAEEIQDKKKIVAALGSLGVQHFSKGDYARTMEYHKKQLQISEELGDKQDIAYAVGSMGLVYSDQGDYAMAMECYSQDLRICEELGDKKGIARVVGNIGIVCKDQGDYAGAMECFERSLQISEELGDKVGTSKTVGNMGTVYSDQGDQSRAMECYEKNLKISEELGNKKGIGIAFVNMGYVYAGQGDYDRAMECYFQRLKISEELGDKRGIGSTVGNMGTVYRTQGDYAGAMECFERSLQISEELGDKHGISLAVGNMGNVYVNQENYASAMECLEKAILMANELGLKPILPWLLFNKAVSLFKQNRFTDAQSTCRECLTIAKEIEHKIRIFQLELLAQKILFAQTEDEAVRGDAVRELRGMLSRTENEEHQAELHYELWQMHSQLGNRRDAIKHREKALKLYKVLYTEKPMYEFKKRIEEIK